MNNETANAGVFVVSPPVSFLTFNPGILYKNVSVLPFRSTSHRFFSYRLLHQLFLPRFLRNASTTVVQPYNSRDSLRLRYSAYITIHRLATLSKLLWIPFTNMLRVLQETFGNFIGIVRSRWWISMAGKKVFGRILIFPSNYKSIITPFSNIMVFISTARPLKLPFVIHCK